VGGDDQWGNIVAGIDLIRRVEGAESHGLTIPLLTTATGAKMGKTVSGALWLDAAKMPVYDYYQYWVNVDDRDVGRFLKLYTFLSLEEIARLEALQGAEIRQAKHVLAFEATAIAHGMESAQQAQSGAAAAFGGGQDVEAMPTFDASLPMSVVELLASSGLCDSKSDARRQITGGAIKIAGQKVSDVHAEITAAHLDAEGAVLLSRGKKKKLRVLGG
jgi:tyrosyl-tRNA synthetase